MVALNFCIPAIANAVIPLAGFNYTIRNLGYGHWLDNSMSSAAEGNPILAWIKNNPETNNQIWTYLDYPTTTANKVFTLQDVSTRKAEVAFQGRGGYMRAVLSTRRVVQSGGPQAWDLILVGPRIYKFRPHELEVSLGNLVATDPAANIVNPATNQVQLSVDANNLNQFWVFNLS